MFKPLRDQVLVRPHERPTRSKGGITIPESVLNETPMTAKVLAVGNGYYSAGVLVKSEIEVNSNIIYMPLAGREIELNGEKLTLLRESEIMGVL